MKRQFTGENSVNNTHLKCECNIGHFDSKNQIVFFNLYCEISKMYFFQYEKHSQNVYMSESMQFVISSLKKIKRRKVG